jgi:hypothetical protein
MLFGARESRASSRVIAPCGYSEFIEPVRSLNHMFDHMWDALDIQGLPVEAARSGPSIGSATGLDPHTQTPAIPPQAHTRTHAHTQAGVMPD